MPSKHKTFVLLLLLAVFSPFINAQEPVKDKITLKTGEVYTGEIVINNGEILIIKIADGSRFQIRSEEIKSIEKTSISESKSNSDTEKDVLTAGNLCGMLDVSGGMNFAQSAFEWSPFFDVSLSFGIKSSQNKSLFAGLGAGYFNTFYHHTSLAYIPLFIRLGSNSLSRKRTSPYFLLDAGYAIGVDEQTPYKGGVFGKLSVGIIHRLNYKTAFFAGPFVSVQSVNGQITEEVNSNTVTYDGYTTLYSFGLKTGIQF
jgi:hypothetical protein